MSYATAALAVLLAVLLAASALVFGAPGSRRRSLGGALSASPAARVGRVYVTPRGPQGYFSREGAQADPLSLYIFGENDEQAGTAARQDSTQAVIRGLSNAVGVRTCYAPGRGYSDDTLAENARKIRKDFVSALDLFRRGAFARVVVPGDGLGTGVAALDSRPEAAKTYAVLCEALDEFLAAARAGV